MVKTKIHNFDICTPFEYFLAFCLSWIVFWGNPEDLKIILMGYKIQCSLGCYLLILLFW